MGDTYENYPWDDEDGTMAVCAFRYCIGRPNFGRVCAKWLIRNWSSLPVSAAIKIADELAAWIDRDDDARRRGDSEYPLGGDYERNFWDILNDLANELPRKG